MDTIETIILTAIVTALANAIVVGILVHRIQKKFETNLLKSVSEHQTKFSRIHEKRVAALENMLQKFRVFTEALNNWIMMIDIYRLKSVELDRDATSKQGRDVEGKLMDFWHYFEDSRMFLPESLIREMGDIFHKAHVAYKWASILAYTYHEIKSVPNEWMEDIKKDFGLKEGTGDLINPASLGRQIGIQAREIISRLEKIYKSVADTEH